MLSVKVHPNASCNEVTGFKSCILQVKVAAPPVKGKANTELVKLLSEVLGVRKSTISLVKCHKSHNKVIAVACLSEQEVIERLSPLLSSDGATTRKATHQGLSIQD